MEAIVLLSGDIPGRSLIRNLAEGLTQAHRDVALIYTV